jgi:hypothetical protein
MTERALQEMLPLPPLYPGTTVHQKLRVVDVPARNASATRGRPA